MRITFHVEIDKRAQLACAPQDRSQPRRQMGDGIGWIGRIHLRIKRGDFDGEIYNGKQFRAVAERIGPAAGFAREMLEQFGAAYGVCSGLLFANYGLAQKIDGEPDVLLPPFAQRFHDVARIFSGDELARHTGDIAPQNQTAKPRNDTRETHAGVNHGREAA